MCLSTNDYFEYENVGFTPVFTNVVTVQLIFVSSSLRPHQPITVIPFRFPQILCTDSHTTIKKDPVANIWSSKASILITLGSRTVPLTDRRENGRAGAFTWKRFWERSLRGT